MGGLDGFLEQVRRVAMPTLNPADERRLAEVIRPLEGYTRAAQRDRREMVGAALQALSEALVESRTGPRAAAQPEPAAPERAPAAPKRRAARKLPPGSAASPAAGRARATAADLELPIAQVPCVTPSLVPRLNK